MNVTQLMGLGGFVSSEPDKVSVTWANVDATTGEDITNTFDVFVLRTTFGNVEKMWTSGDDKSKSAILITECLRFGEDAQERLTYEQALSLQPGLAAALMEAYNSVNARRSAPKT
jgi:hypothetical protein